MNRWDQIDAIAQGVAERVCPDPDDRDQVAHDLIHLIVLLVSAVGESVAIEGRASRNEAVEFDGLNGEARDAHNRYLLGEGIQDGARQVYWKATGNTPEKF